MKKLKVFETFSGIGAQHKALEILKKENPNFDFEIVATCDWDVYANIAYDAIFHNSIRERERERFRKKK
ncbi:DNA cytosine methyltransferase [Mesomycoplasma neurolyticum]|uniref:Uncharacterized protein n=1 Tax=Mesomycoplasma neurolyticum TaxID=2120 RepID=A0A449A5Z7_9BACT|nr:DNA cytosine methyltransferase [Mesomycoplasma neurolyticum]VEU59681.1 Uncharacterised protein [Mesomycoplasma neurolyticum]